MLLSESQSSSSEYMGNISQMVCSNFAEVGSKEQTPLRQYSVYASQECVTAVATSGESLQIIVSVSLTETLLLNTSGELARFNKRQ